MQIRGLNSNEHKTAATLVGLTPLLQRYQFGVEKALRSFSQLGPKDFIYGAFEGAELLGFSWIQCESGFGRTPYLKLIVIDPRKQRGGVGAKLLEHCEHEHLAKAGLLLLVSHWNQEAQNFYQKKGYQKVGVLPRYVLPDTDEWIYFKPGA